MKQKITLSYLNPIFLPNFEHEFSKQAAKGWLIDEIFELTMKYKRTEPKNLKFNIILHPTQSMENRNYEKLSEYETLCVQSGWELRTRHKEYSVFSTDKLDAVPLHFESSDHHNNVKKKIDRFRNGNVAIILLTLLLLYLFIGSHDYLDDLSYYSFGQTLSFALVTCGLFINLVLAWMWTKRNAVRHHNGSFEFSDLIYRGSKAVTLLFVVGFLLHLAFTERFQMFGGYYLVIYVIYTNIKTYRHSRMTKHRYSASLEDVVILSASVLLILLNYSGGVNLLYRDHFTSDRALKLGDFITNPMPEEITDHPQAGPNILTITDYFEHDGTHYVQTKIMKFDSQKKLQSFWNELLKHHRLGEETIVEWGVIGYYVEVTDGLIYRDKDEIVIIYTDFDLRSEANQEIVKKRLDIE
jgi:hypothetical protein